MHVLVVVPTPADFDERVKTIAADVEIVHVTPGEDGYDEALTQSSVILGRPPVGDVPRATELRWLQLSSAGANNYVGKISSDITLTTASGVYGIPTSEHALAMMLALTRSIHKSARDQVNRRWDPSGEYRELHGTTCGLLGLGDIGLAVAQRARAFGMRVLAARRNPDSTPDAVDEVFAVDQLDEMLGQCDHVVNTLPETAFTRKLLDEKRLWAMKKGSFLYNIGRGTTVDQDALVEMLFTGHLAGAGLDVFEEEPLPKESPLWGMSNVIITPHTGGSSPHEDERVAAVFLENLRRFARGEPLKNVVDHDVGY